MHINKDVKLVLGFVCFLFIFCLYGNMITKAGDKKRVLYINSYHKGYEWSDIIGDTIIGDLNEHAGGELEIKREYMDTKRNNSEEFKLATGVKMRKIIESWKPDIIIGSDDNVAKYVITPYFLNSNIPFVFCGLNEDPKIYGFPAKNVTGIREIDLVEPLYNHLRKYAHGTKVGYLTADKDVQRIMARVNEEQIGRKFDKIYFVKDFEEWKKYFLIIQNEVDILFMQDVCIVPGWQNEDAIKFLQENIKIPNGCTTDIQKDFCLICISKSPKEHGLWAAEAALKILHGAKPSDIPIIINRKGYLILNLILADKLNIVFPPSMLRAAEIIVDKKGEKQ